MTRRGKSSGGVLVGVMAVMVLSGCGSSASGGGAPEVRPAAPVATPAGFTRVGGTSYAFGLPAGMSFAARTPVTQDGGKVVRSWFHDLGSTGSGPFCAVVASEQPRYRPAFPADELAVFAAVPGRDVLRNEKLTPPPPGTVAAIVQESTTTVSGADWKPLLTHTFQRLYLTPGRTLITLTVAAPESRLSSCDPAGIVATLQATGQEAAADGATSAGGTSGSSS